MVDNRLWNKTYITIDRLRVLMVDRQQARAPSPALTTDSVAGYETRDRKVESSPVLRSPRNSWGRRRTMFRPRKKEFRRRAISATDDQSSEDDGNVSDASVGTVPTVISTTAAVAPSDTLSSSTSSVSSRPKKMRKKVKGKGDKGVKPVLSFGHEDEDENGGGGIVGGGNTGDKSVFRVKKSKASKVGDGGGG